MESQGNMKEVLGEDVVVLLKNFIETKIKESQFRFYTGRIVNNNDPDKLGRCKVRVYGVFSNEIPDSDLPWAYPDFQFVGSNVGSFVVPEVDCFVNVYFDDNDMSCPMYTSKVLNQNDLGNMAADKDEDYPDTVVFFEMGDSTYCKYNRKTHEYELRHASGTLINIDKTGNLTITTEDTSGNIKIVSQKDVNITAVAKDVNIESKGIPGNITLTPSPIGAVNLSGPNSALPVNNIPACLFNGAVHGVGTNIPGRTCKAG